MTALFKPHGIREMWTMVIDDPGVCQSRGLAVQKRLNGSTSCFGLIPGDPRNIVLDGVATHHGEGEGVRCGLCQITFGLLF